MTAGAYYGISEVDPRADNLLVGATALAVAAAVKSSPLGLARQRTGAGWGKTAARPDFSPWLFWRAGIFRNWTCSDNFGRASVVRTGGVELGPKLLGARWDGPHGDLARPVGHFSGPGPPAPRQPIHFFDSSGLRFISGSERFRC